MGVGLGIGLNWLNRVEPSLTQWITGGVLHKMGGVDFFVCSFILWRKLSFDRVFSIEFMPSSSKRDCFCIRINKFIWQIIILKG